MVIRIIVSQMVLTPFLVVWSSHNHSLSFFHHLFMDCSVEEHLLLLEELVIYWLVVRLIIKRELVSLVIKLVVVRLLVITVVILVVSLHLALIL